MKINIKRLSNKSYFNDFTPARMRSDGVIFIFGGLLDSPLSLSFKTFGLSSFPGEKLT